MSETKFSVMRSFGTEQFSVTTTLPDLATEEDVQKALQTFDTALTKMHAQVLSRGDEEKKFLIAASKKREELNTALNNQLKAEVRAATEASETVRKAEKLNAKKK